MIRFVQLPKEIVAIEEITGERVGSITPNEFDPLRPSTARTRNTWIYTHSDEMGKRWILSQNGYPFASDG